MIMVKNAKILTTSFVMVLITACSTTSLYTKMSEEEMIRLAKVDSLYTKISKIIAPNGQEISKEDAINLSPADYYGERFIDQITDSIVVKIRKARKSDTKLKQKNGFYSFYDFIILLHSDGFFKKKYFEEIKKAVRRGDLDKRHLAYFKDKMAVSNEKKQRYGTQMAFDDDGNMILAPVDNIKKVNKRRKKIGLPPVE